MRAGSFYSPCLRPRKLAKGAGTMLLATKQAAERLGVHPATIRRWAASGRVRYERIGRERAIPAEEVARLLRERAKADHTASSNR